MAENFSNQEKETDIQIQEAQKVPHKMNPKRWTPRHIKLSKVKNRILKQQEKSNLLCTRDPHKTNRRFFSRNLTGQKRVK